MNAPTLEPRAGWGGASHALSHVCYPESTADVREAFALAAERGWSVAFWGNGRSYGDAALNDGELLLDFSHMNRILSLDVEAGVVRVEPGVTLAQLWKRSLQKGLWPAVVTGTMTTTMGGCTAANVHGKNHVVMGPWGDHVLSLELVLASGEVRELSREQDPELFHHVIGGYGLFGAVTALTLKLERVYSGRVRVTPELCASLDLMFEGFERYNRSEFDYVVGWIDAFASGPAMGRGQLHAANHPSEGEDPEGAQQMLPGDQVLPSRFFGVVPKGWLWWMARPWAHRLGMRWINALRFAWMARGDRQVHLESHAAFQHLLDFVPDWKRFYGREGLIQYQLFVPEDQARAVFKRVLEMAQLVQLEPWLVVMKRHRRDDFPLSHALDGYSLAMDFRVTAANRQHLWQLCQRFNELVVEAGGRFYFAKDSVLQPKHVLGAWGPEVLARWFEVKDRVDPDGRLQGNLYRRLLAPLRQQLPPTEPPAI